MVINVSAGDFLRYGGNAWASTGFDNTVFTQNTLDAVNQNVLANFYCESGHYDLFFSFLKHSGGAIVELHIDGAFVENIDLYNAVTQVAHPTLNNVLLAAGWHSIEVHISDKNPGSSGYSASVGGVVVKSH